MDSSMASVGGSGDEGSDNFNQGRRPSYKRLTSAQTARLERFIKDCPHPDEAQRRQLASEIGLETKQVKFWFQNKRTQIKHEKVSSLLARYLEKQMSPPEFQQVFNIPIIGSSSHAPKLENSSLNYEIGGSSSHGPSLYGMQIMDGHDHNLMGSEGIEKTLMLKVAASAMEELVRLIRINEPCWIKSSTQDGQLILQHENYEKMFPRTNNFKGVNLRVEATKDSGIVSINSIQLVDMFLDSDKWINLFPTIVTKAKTIKVLENGLVGSRSGALQLMFEQMHVLSPLVQPREFQFLRYCEQIEEGVWVTWVEHVEVDDKIQTHQLYKDLIGTGIAYGTERWIMELQRIGERFACFYVERIPIQDSGGVINSLEGRRSVMNFCHRMIKVFCESLTMSGNLDFPLLKMENNSGVRVSIRKNRNHLGQPKGVIVVAATSIWLPLHYMKVFEFLTDDRRRAQWDVLCCGNNANKVAHISNGIHPGNCISISRPFIPSENNALILQESFTTPMGSYVVYAPTDVASMISAINGEDSSMLPVLPSGFVISADGEPNAALEAFNSSDIERLGGSLLTVAFQILASSPDGINMPNMESVAAVNSLLTSTILKVKDALNCNNLE
ncbi:homeobox-leucine zipper protein HDG11 [Glycine max]|uniref:homeobox-leucine zipper protein HDG11 n=1 Tax=Glycine max TaxID=3847 RepID=UPI001B3550AE|nr:homeobox-leucine zipper protein HDG11 [Glycine max]